MIATTYLVDDLWEIHKTLSQQIGTLASGCQFCDDRYRRHLANQALQMLDALAEKIRDLEVSP